MNTNNDYKKLDKTVPKFKNQHKLEEAAYHSDVVNAGDESEENDTSSCSSSLSTEYYYSTSKIQKTSVHTRFLMFTWLVNWENCYKHRRDWKPYAPHEA